MNGAIIGVDFLNIDDFYFKFIGSANPPQTINNWQKIPETALATVTMEKYL